MQRQLSRTVTCSPYRAHNEPMFYANKVLERDKFLCSICIHVQLCRVHGQVFSQTSVSQTMSFTGMI